MEFSKEIKQSKPFSSEQVKAMLNVAYTADKQHERMLKLLKPFNINDQHYNILRILNGQKGKSISPGKVKEVLINSRGDLTRLVDKLVRMELVERSYGEVDRRSVALKINKRGRSLLNKIKESFDSNRVYDFQITDDEAKQLNTLLDKLRG